MGFFISIKVWIFYYIFSESLNSHFFVRLNICVIFYICVVSVSLFVSVCSIWMNHQYVIVCDSLILYVTILNRVGFEMIPCRVPCVLMVCVVEFCCFRLRGSYCVWENP